MSQMRLWLGCLALVAASGAGAFESRVSGADVAQIRAVIQRQLDALRRDDACSRFSARPASVSFLELVVLGEEVVQQVQVIDRAGGRWFAYYAMERQKDGGWRTIGCRLVQPGRPISA